MSGTVTVDDAGTATGSGDALALYNEIAAQQTAASPLPDPAAPDADWTDGPAAWSQLMLPLIVKIKRAWAREAQAHANVFSSGGGGTDLLFSPASQGEIWSAGLAGNFTFGYGWQFLRPVTITGARFFAAYAGTKNAIIRVSDASSGVTIYTETFNGLSGGMNTVTFATPVAVTDCTKTYVVSVYLGSAVYAGFASSSANQPAANYPFLVGSAAIIKSSYYTAGNAAATSGGSTSYPSIEPVFT